VPLALPAVEADPPEFEPLASELTDPATPPAPVEVPPPI
jgi:hypothetical protein